MTRWDASQSEAAAKAVSYLQQNDDSLCLVLVKDGRPVGTGIFDKNNEVEVALSPWLVGLYVEPDQRGNGYGLVLTEARIDYARGFGYKQIYLDTVNAREYHERHGWKYVCDGNYRGEKTEIMMLDL